MAKSLAACRREPAAVHEDVLVSRAKAHRECAGQHRGVSEARNLDLRRIGHPLLEVAADGLEQDVAVRAREVAFVLVLVAMMLPFQVTVVPVDVLFSKLHLVGSLWPLVIPNFLGDAFSIFLLRQFFLTIPEEYADAARVDGCGELRILFSVFLRLAKPAIAAVALFEFLFCSPG
jgi:Binding-protein-dependent transport system inner membrane component